MTPEPHVRPLAPVTVRLLSPHEEPMVEDSWQRSFRRAAEESLPLVAQLPPDAYRKAQRVVIHRVLRRAAVLVATFPSVPDEVVGYVVLESREPNLVLHWLYVKQPFRGHGIARALLAQALQFSHATLAHTHETRAGQALAKKLRSQFIPSLAR